MTIQQQIIFLIYLSIFLIPIILTYFFFPELKGFYDEEIDDEEIDIGETVMVGIIMSALFFGFIFLLTTLIKVFPLLGIPLLGFLLYKLYKNWKRIANTAIDNYKRYHMKE